MNQVDVSLARLLSRGDKVFIDKGRLAIKPNSGKVVPSWFMERHGRIIILDTLTLVGISGYEYMSYSTGHYGQHKAGGVTLQFVDLLRNKDAYACFNADLKRKRNSSNGKKGHTLPKDQFSVGRRSHFYQFWQSTGLPLPVSLTRFYECMGKLKSFIFTATIENSRLQTDTLRPIDICHEQLLSAHNFHINNTQFSHKQHIRVAHKELPKTQLLQAITQNQTTCNQNYGNKVIRIDGNKGNDISLSNTVIKKTPQEQTDEEWLEDYMRGE